MKCTGLAVLGVALVTATAASAQTTVTRQVSEMPVETIITRSAAGTTVERRVLPMEGEVVTAPIVRRAPMVSRTVTTTVRSNYPPRRTTRVVTARRPAPVYAMATADTVMLSPDERDIVYREIVRPVGPTGILAPFSPLLPPAPAVSYSYAQPVYGSSYAQPVYGSAAPLRTAYVVGSRLPADIRLTEIPAPVLMRIPSLAPYAYAMVDGRILLVDPQTGIIVADIT